ncbi:MAG: hypothetical protein OXU20_01885 [Myxococcales bacterium]|nr:hypothetical protein [Myxococcales bacterium]
MRADRTSAATTLISLSKRWRWVFGFGCALVLSACNDLLGIEESVLVATSCDAPECTVPAVCDGSACDTASEPDAALTIEGRRGSGTAPLDGGPDSRHPTGSREGDAGGAPAPSSERDTGLPDAATNGNSTCSREGELGCRDRVVVACSEGHFVDRLACPYRCVEGECLGECSPGETRCLADSYEVCGDDAVFAQRARCAGDCTKAGCVPCDEHVQRCVGREIQRCDAEGTYERREQCEFDCATDCGGFPVGRFEVVDSCSHLAPEMVAIDAGVCTPKPVRTTARYSGTLRVTADHVVTGTLTRPSHEFAEVSGACLQELMLMPEHCELLGQTRTDATDTASPDVKLSCVPSGAGCACTQSAVFPVDDLHYGGLSLSINIGNYCEGEDGRLRLQAGAPGAQNVIELARVRTDHRLESTPPQLTAQLGFAVAMDGDTLAAAAPFESDDAGAVHIFVREGEEWNQAARLSGSRSAPGDTFGYSLALEGGTLVVGAPGHDARDPSGAAVVNSGAVYVFERAQSTWTEQAYLHAAPVGAGDAFGRAVDISGDRLAVGAPYEDSNSRVINGDRKNDDLPKSGAVYVFARDAARRWAEEAFVKAASSDVDGWFGDAVALAGDMLLVGASGERAPDQRDKETPLDVGARRGAVYAYHRSEGQWTAFEHLLPSHGGTPSFGTSVAFDGRTAVVGAPGDARSVSGTHALGADAMAHVETPESLPRSGAAYVFVRTSSGFSPEAYLKANAPLAGDRFGRRVAALGSVAAVSSARIDALLAPRHGAPPPALDEVDAGAVYQFYRGREGWSQVRFLVAPEMSRLDDFGSDLALSGVTLVIGAHLEEVDGGADGGADADAGVDEVLNAGAVYLYE